jgi:cytochrome b561
MTTTERALAPEPSARAERPPFDAVTIAVHWTTVVLVLALLALGWSIHRAPDAETATRLVTAHRSLGVSLWTLSLLRLGWRFTGARFPSFPETMPKAQQIAAKLSEYGLYLLLLAQPLTGMTQSLYRGKPFALFLWQVPALVARDKAMVARVHEIHEQGAWLLAGLIGLHACAGLFHALVLRDGVFTSMAPVGRRRR